nr:multidrug efflux SMR transporter [Rhabdothermincola salaria]
MVIAGLFEVGWASVLPATGGFRRPVPTAVVLLCMVVSLAGLEYASRTIPIGTAYAVWTGAAVAGTVVAGMVVHQDPATIPRMLALMALLGALTAVKLTSP